MGSLLVVGDSLASVVGNVTTWRSRVTGVHHCTTRTWGYFFQYRGWKVIAIYKFLRKLQNFENSSLTVDCGIGKIKINKLYTYGTVQLYGSGGCRYTDTLLVHLWTCKRSCQSSCLSSSLLYNCVRNTLALDTSSIVKMPNRNGRWNSPSQNVDFFLASSPGASCCQEAAHLNCWKHQADEDITTAIEKLEKQKSLFSSFDSSPRVPHSQSVSLPASAWSSTAFGSSPCSPSSSNNSSHASSPFTSFSPNNSSYWMQNIQNSYGTNYPGKFNFSNSSGQMSSSNLRGGSSSVMSQGSKMSMTPSNSSSRSSSCYQDRLYQMDWSQDWTFGSEVWICGKLTTVPVPALPESMTEMFKLSSNPSMILYKNI